MNLSEFLNYKTTCPLCESDLNIVFHSQKKQSIRLEDKRLLIKFPLDALKKGQVDYKVGYSFGLEDNSWYIEFYNKVNARFDNEAPSYLIDRFKELNKNLAEYHFYRSCPCACYYYRSNPFKLEFKSSNIGELEVHAEYIGVSQMLDEHKEKSFKNFVLINDYLAGKSSFVLEKSASPLNVRYDHVHVPNESYTQTSLIKFTNKEETMERLKKLLVFS